MVSCRTKAVARTGTGRAVRGFAALLVLTLVACQSASPDRPSAEVAPADTAPVGSGLVDEDGRRVEPAEVGPTGPEFYRGTGELIRRPAEAEVAFSDDGAVTLNFANAELREVVDAVLGRTLGLNYAIEPSLQGMITARTGRPLARADVIPAFEQILALNGAALTRAEGPAGGTLYRIVPLQQAGSGLGGPAVGPGGGDPAQGAGITILPLRYVSAEALADMLRPFVAPGRTLRAETGRNLIVFAGPGAEARELAALVETFDVDRLAGRSLGLFPVATTTAETLIGELDAVFGPMTDPASPVVRFLPVERLNAVLTVATQPAALERVASWIERLDRGAEGSGRRIYVYHVENVRAADLAEVLEQVVAAGPGTDRGPATAVPASAGPDEAARDAPSEAAPEPVLRPLPDGSLPEVPPTLPRPARQRPESAASRGDALDAIQAFDGREVRIIADEPNNALVILATATEYRMIRATLNRLDIRPLQVLIEATIAEVTLNDALRYGLQWFFKSGNSSATFSRLESGAVAPDFPGFSYRLEAGDARVVLDALDEVTDVKFVSSPRLMVRDNASGRIQIGEQVPVATQSAVSVTDPDAPVVNAIQFRDTGVILEVTPRVNAGGLVTLELRQEVSEAGATTTSGLNSPTIAQRSIETTVAVQNGATIGLGGLIRERDERGVSGVPVVSEAPVLGNLFKTTDTQRDRTELLVFLTPRVVGDSAEALAATETLRRQMRALEPLRNELRGP